MFYKYPLRCPTPQALEVTVWREGLDYTQTYSRGKPVTTLNCVMLPFENKDRQGTRIKFWPDKEGSYGHSFLVYGFSVAANFSSYICFPFFSLLDMQYSPPLLNLSTTQ
jgi:hypothetical protein